MDKIYLRRNMGTKELEDAIRHIRKEQEQRQGDYNKAIKLNNSVLDMVDDSRRHMSFVSEEFIDDSELLEIYYNRRNMANKMIMEIEDSMSEMKKKYAKDMEGFDRKINEFEKQIKNSSDDFKME